jgi:6-phosphogluconolactonase (cycloisomerase 2 family)
MQSRVSLFTCAVAFSLIVQIVACGGGGGGVPFPPTPPAPPNPPATAPQPAASVVSPFRVAAGSGGFTLTVQGNNFVSASSVQWNGSARPTTFISSNQLTASISAADVATPGVVHVTVSTPAPGGGTSPALRFGIDSGTPSARFVYATDANSGAVSAFSLDNTTGALGTVTGSPFSLVPSTSVGRIVIDRYGKFLYAVLHATAGCKSCASIAGFQIGSSGQLTPVPGSPYTASTSFPVTDPLNIAIDPSGNRLFISGTLFTVPGTGVATCLIDPDTGALSTPIISTFGAPGTAGTLALSADGGVLYGSPTGGISAGSIAANNNVATLSGSPFGSPVGFFAIGVDPLGKFLFATDGTIFPPQAIFSFSVDKSTGALTQQSVLNVTTIGGIGQVMAVHPSGSFVYLPAGFSNVLAFSVDPATGSLTPLAGSPFTLSAPDPNPVVAAIDPSGKFLFIGSGIPSAAGNGNVSVFAIAANGSLTEVAGSPFALTSGPDSIAFAR